MFEWSVKKYRMQESDTKVRKKNHESQTLGGISPKFL